MKIKNKILYFLLGVSLIANVGLIYTGVNNGIKIYNGDNTETVENCIIASYDFTGTPDNGVGVPCRVALVLI